MIKRYIPVCVFALISLFASARDLNTEITVQHEVVPEEQAATRLRILPVLTLPTVNPGRLTAASGFAPGKLTPYIIGLDAAPYLSTLNRSPWRGYAALGYGPIYNLAASAGYRFVETDRLTVDAYMQFDGDSYESPYPALPIAYDGKVRFRRNTGMIGANTVWKATTTGQLKASVLYRISDYNFPILDLGSLLTDRNQITANQARIDAEWGAKGKIDYSVGVKYDMIHYGRDFANNNRGELRGNALWHFSEKSSLGLDLVFSLTNSALVGNKGVLRFQPHYVYTSRNFTGRFGVDLDVKTGNVRGKSVVVSPRVDLVWQPTSYFNVWGKLVGRLDDNYRGALYEEQPYLLPDFDAGFSRLYTADAGITVGPWRGASISVFGGYAMAYDWYMPAVESGYMAPIDVKGFHGGVSFKYDYRRYLSLNVSAELAQSPDGNYSRGYAPWRDHAKFNLAASAIVRPIAPLEIELSYKLRTGRQKTLGQGKDMDLQKINNLAAGVRYAINDRWSVFVRGENLMNKHWYLGPAVPSQGIMGLVGATYKF